MEKKLQSFHRRCIRSILEQDIQMNPDGSWTCPSSKEALEKAGLCTIWDSIHKWQVAAKSYARIFQSTRNVRHQPQPLASLPNQLVLWQKPQDEWIWIYLALNPNPPGNGGGLKVFDLGPEKFHTDYCLLIKSDMSTLLFKKLRIRWFQARRVGTAVCVFLRLFLQYRIGMPVNILMIVHLHHTWT